jgi:aminoglycoside 3-N-acetyltransferase
MSPREVREFRARMPAFDSAKTVSTNGKISEALRTTAGAVRSDHPQSSFAAVGAEAAALMAGHRLGCHLGEQSPLGRLYQRDALILLLGAGYAACTAMHLAEYRYTPRPPMRTYACVVNAAGGRRWITYRDVALDDSDFCCIGEMIDKNPIADRGSVGNARSLLLPLRQTVNIATEWMARNRR